jgi:hypothetical protein
VKIIVEKQSFYGIRRLRTLKFPRPWRRQKLKKDLIRSGRSITWNPIMKQAALLLVALILAGAVTAWLFTVDSGPYPSVALGAVLIFLAVWAAVGRI